jgi:hypothetical protein
LQTKLPFPAAQKIDAAAAATEAGDVIDHVGHGAEHCGPGALLEMMSAVSGTAGTRSRPGS